MFGNRSLTASRALLGELHGRLCNKVIGAGNGSLDFDVDQSRARTWDAF